MLTSYSDANKVEESSLLVRYSKVRISGSWSWVSANVEGYYAYMWECHRYATKTFRYVGMDKATAISCRDALVTLFTRAIRSSIWSGDAMGGAWAREDGGSQLMADVRMVPSGGGMYDVSVSVNEDDVMLAKIAENPNPSIQFATEDARQYDLSSN